jgi:hypothetical protein
MTIDAAIDALVRYGLAAVLVFVTIGFLYAIVIPRVTHKEIVGLWKERYEGERERGDALAKDNERLWDLAMKANTQAARSASIIEEVIDPSAVRRGRER